MGEMQIFLWLLKLNIIKDNLAVILDVLKASDVCLSSESHWIEMIHILCFMLHILKQAAKKSWT